MKKVYYRIDFKLISPLAIGSGENESTDKDIIKNSCGMPYIPGSTLAGAYRALFNKENQKKYFGTIDGSIAESSKVIVYDGTLKEGQTFNIGKRDCVSLDEFKTAKEGSKFDFEMLEPGVRFVTYIEQDMDENDDNIAKEIAKAWKQGDISFGGKKERGLGQVGEIKINETYFNLSITEDVDRWLDFDVFNDDCWDVEIAVDNIQSDLMQMNYCTNIRIDLIQESPISIRTYTTDICEDGISPDQKQLIYTRNGKDIPVVPGTSWAGCFLHNIRNLGVSDVESVFGSTDMKSKIYFSESEIENAKSKVVSRNAIDRFTGGCVENALFTEKIYYGGKTILNIKIKEQCTKEFNAVLAATIVDLHMGFVALGGETAIGHGLFSVDKIQIDGQEIVISEENVEQMYTDIVEALVRKEVAYENKE